MYRDLSESSVHDRYSTAARAVEPALCCPVDYAADFLTAIPREIIERDYPFSTLKEQANVLIFPNLSAGNIAYKLLNHLGGATAIGPILVGMSRPVHVLERGADVQDIVNMAAVAVVDAQERTYHHDQRVHTEIQQYDSHEK